MIESRPSAWWRRCCSLASDVRDDADEPLHVDTPFARLPGEHGRLIVVSPHCDDAVFGCGQILADVRGAVVVTVFAGRPVRYPTLTPWDEASGFGPGDDPVSARRDEDRAALTVLGARPLWLEFCDAQYGLSPSVSAIAPALEAAILAASPAVVLVPLGLFHSDHHLTRDAALVVAERLRGVAWVAYADALYRRLPGLVDEALMRFRDAGLEPSPTRVMPEGCAPAKRRAVACYRSQLRALRVPGHPGIDDVFAPEQYWRLTR